MLIVLMYLMKTKIMFLRIIYLHIALIIPVNMVDYDGNSAVAIAGGYGLYVWAFAGANAWNIIGQVVLVGMAVVTIVLAIKIVYDKTSGKKLLKMVRRLPDTGLLKMVQREKLMTNIQNQDRGVKVKRKR